MPSLKTIRKRIGSVKSTQKITRAMKMVAGARLARAQSRILAMRPYAVNLQQVLGAVVGGVDDEQNESGAAPLHPLLVRRPGKRVLYIVLSSDRGLCGSFNAQVNKASERLWREAEAEGNKVSFYVVGRKARDYLKRRSAPVDHEFAGVWDKLDASKAREIAQTALAPFKRGEVDAIYLVYNLFKSAVSQELMVDPLLPIAQPEIEKDLARDGAASVSRDYLFEPDRGALLDRLVPMYLEIAILRALYESQASEFGARMSAMDSATKNAKEMIGKLTLQYNRARQAAITKELMEIIGGSEALKELSRSG
jgi:F-type H+-transporting ATPase subunit gamma